jgi:hypothetical protein
MAFTPKLLQEVQQLSEQRDISRKIFIAESAEQYLGKIYTKIENENRTLKQQDLKPEDLAKALAGFRVLGKADMRAGFADISKPKLLLQLLNDIDEISKDKEFGEYEYHKVDADDRIAEIGEAAPSYVEQYEELLKSLDDEKDNSAAKKARETLLRDIGKMRTFYEQMRNKLKTLLSQQSQQKQNLA